MSIVWCSVQKFGNFSDNFKLLIINSRHETGIFRELLHNKMLQFISLHLLSLRLCYSDWFQLFSSTKIASEFSSLIIHHKLFFSSLCCLYELWENTFSALVENSSFSLFYVCLMLLMYWCIWVKYDLHNSLNVFETSADRMELRDWWMKPEWNPDDNDHDANNIDVRFHDINSLIFIYFKLIRKIDGAS